MKKLLSIVDAFFAWADGVAIRLLDGKKEPTNVAGAISRTLAKRLSNLGPSWRK